MTLSETVAVTGNVNLILPDNTTLTAPYGINIPANASLTVWGQSGRSGKLTVLARTDSQSGIGGAGVITINGGIVEATSETGGGGIACCGVTINGGQVTAQGNPGIVAQQGTASLSWTHSDDSITASSYSGTVTLRKTFVDAFGTLYQAGAVSTIGTLYGKTLRPAPHNYIKVEKVEPTYDPQTGVYSNGNIEYYTCSDCDSCFTYDSAANAYTEIAASAVVVPYFAINDNGTYVRIMKYNGTDSVITVPDTVPDSCPDESLRGKPITSINQSAFKENTTITRVTMGDNIVHIGWEAFRYASNLEEIVVGSGLRILDSSTFYNTPNLTKFTCTNTEHQIALTRYPFDASSDITFYGMHKGAFRTAYEHSTFKVSVASFQYIGIDEHTVTCEDNSACTATICADCDLDETMDAEVTVLEKPGQAYNILSETVYTASVTYESVLYTDEKTVVSAGSGTKADPYIISNAEVWNAVAANISNGIDADKCFKLADGFSDTVTVKNGDSTVTISGLQNVYSTRKQAGDGGNNFVRNADSLLVKRTRPTGICQSVTAADGNTYYYNTVTLSGLKESYTTSNAASRHYALTDEAGYALVKDTDHTVSMEPEEVTGEGSYTLTFSGKGNYEGTISFTFTVESTVGDVLNRDFTGVGATTAYKDWSGKAGASGAIYAGNSAGDHGAIQLRSANSTSGIITTASRGLVSKVSVLWNDNTGAATSERSLLIYGKNTSYESPTDLYDEEKQGTLLGKIVYGEETAELEITGDYACIGLRSSNGALFLQEVTIRWAQTLGFTVTFDSDGGSAVEAQTVPTGATVIRPEDPTNGDFAFMGWYQVTATDPTETLAETKFDFENTDITEDITLKAKWAELSSKMSWTFDDDDPLAGWTFIDKDGDNHNWELIKREDYKTHSSPGMLHSASYDNESSSLRPDNWAITPLIRIPEDSELSLWIVSHVIRQGGILAVYIGDDLNDLTGWERLGGDYEAVANYAQVKIDLSAYAGQDRYIAFRHYNCTNHFAVSLDDVSVERRNTQVTVTFDSDGGSSVDARTVTYGDKIARPEDPTREGYTFKGWYQVTDTTTTPETLAETAFDFENTAIIGSITLKAVWEAASTVTINGVSGSFNDKIKLNFYFGVPDAVRADEAAYVTLTNTNTSKTVTLPVKDATLDADKGRKFSIELAAKEASDTITAKVFDGAGNALTIICKTSGTDYTETCVEYTLMQYFTWLETKGSDENEQAVGAAAKDYCAAAQIYFNYNADGVSVSSRVDAVTTVMLSGYAATRECTLPTGVTVRGITAMLESDNTLRLYLGFKDVNPADLTFAIDDKPVALQTRSDGTTYLALDAGVWSNRLQVAHAYSVSDGTNTYTISASVLTYARSEAIKSADRDTQLGKALYLYNKAAVAAFGD